MTGYPSEPHFEKLWPADYLVLGKDIVKFHSIYFPAFLMGADLNLPRKLITHAWWTSNKVKMSKSLGNVIHPASLIDTYGIGM
jgi:methionyl-tRNA synthetase